MTLDAILFYVFGSVALLSALVVVAQRNPMYSAFALIVTLASLSAVFGLLGSPFIAVLQVIVYGVGAVKLGGPRVLMNWMIRVLGAISHRTETFVAATFERFVTDVR